MRAKSKRTIILSLAICMFAFFGVAFGLFGLCGGNEVKAASYDLASSGAGWWIDGEGTLNHDGGVTTMTRGESTVAYYVGADSLTKMTGGKTYVIKLKVKSTADISANIAINEDWTNGIIKSGMITNREFGDYLSLEYTPEEDFTAHFIFQLTAGSGNLIVTDFTISEKATAANYTLTFKGEPTEDLTAVAGVWWSEGRTMDDNGVTFERRDDAIVSQYAGAADYTSFVAGKKYTISLKIKTTANLSVVFAINDPWLVLVHDWMDHADYTEYNYVYEATTTAVTNFIFQLQNGSGSITIKDFTIAEIVETKTVTADKAIGELPAIPEKQGFTGYWAIDGNAITAETLYAYGADKTAEIVYEKIMDITAASVSLEGDIGLNFYAELGDVNEKATFTVDGKTIDAIAKNVSGTTYVFTYNVAAKDYAKEVTLTLGEGEKALSRTTSIKKYIEVSKNEFSGNLLALVNALESYCASASAYFGGETVDEATFADEKINDFAVTKEGAAGEGITFEGFSLILESETVLRIYFSGENASKAVCSIDGNTVAPKSHGGNVYYIEKTNISAKDIDSVYTFVIGGLTIRSSALGYVCAAVNNAETDANLVNLLKTLYNYNVAANAYFENIERATSMADTVKLAGDLENGVQAQYTDASKSGYTVSNNGVSLTHGLTSGSGKLFISSLKDKNGNFTLPIRWIRTSLSATRQYTEA